MGVGALTRRQRPIGGRAWGVGAVVAAVVVAGPLVVLPLSFFGRADTADVVRDILPQAVSRSLVLALGVAIGTLLIGGSLAVLLSFYDFPGRRFLEWAVVFPLGMPAYILTFVLLGQYDERFLRDLGIPITLPEIRSAWGAIAVLSLVLYPYVYMLGRTAFLNQAPHLLEAARSLGHSHLRSIIRVALPLARPALAAGVSLAVMEALADFGAVNLLGYRALPDAIYRVWYGAFDRQAALQLGAVLLGLVTVMILVERASRRRSTTLTTMRGGAPIRKRLRSWRAALAFALPTLLLLGVVVAPVVQLVRWAIDGIRNGTYDATLVTNVRNSVLLALMTSALTVIIAVVTIFAVRLAPTRTRRLSMRAATLGYAVPGSVAAAGVFIVADGLGRLVGTVLTASLAALVVAFCVRFTTLAIQSGESRMDSLPRSLDDAARSLGAGPARVLGEVHLPLLLPALATGAALVFVEVVKELPATALLRPFGLDTLPIAVWEATKESLYETASLPALLLLVVSMVPVAFLVRRSPGSR